MDVIHCTWHRPGKLIGKTRVCRKCGVGVEECPCSNFGRNPVSGCPACDGSAWVAIARTSAEVVRQSVEV